MTGLSQRWKIALLLALGLLSIDYFYLVTNGDWRLIFPEVYGLLFPQVWQRFLEGRFDVDLSVFEGFNEHFVRDGKYYTYFGFFPSLLRGVGSLFVRPSEFDLSRISCWLAAVLHALMQTLILVRLKLLDGEFRPFALVYLASLVLAGPVVYVLGPAFMYHEAILWGVAWTAVFMFGFTQLTLPQGCGSQRWSLLIMGLGAGFSLMSRVSFGLATQLALTGYLVTQFLCHTGRLSGLANSPGWPRPPKKSELLPLLLTWPLLVLLTGVINYGRWGSPFQFGDLKFYITYLTTPRGAGMSQAGLFNLDRIPLALEYYLFPHWDNFSTTWPYFQFSRTLHLIGFPTYMDNVEDDLMPITLTCLLPFGLACLGVRGLRKGPGGDAWPIGTRAAFILLAVAMSTAWLVNLTQAGLTLRYHSDLFPLLWALGLAGLLRLKPALLNKNLKQRQQALVLMIAIVGVSLTASHLASIFYKLDSYAVHPNNKTKLMKTWFASEAPGPGR